VDNPTLVTKIVSASPGDRRRAQSSELYDFTYDGKRARARMTGTQLRKHLLLSPQLQLNAMSRCAECARGQVWDKAALTLQLQHAGSLQARC
jgi:hypothetical protein